MFMKSTLRFITPWLPLPHQGVCRCEKDIGSRIGLVMRMVHSRRPLALASSSRAVAMIRATLSRSQIDPVLFLHHQTGPRTIRTKQRILLYCSVAMKQGKKAITGQFMNQARGGKLRQITLSICPDRQRKAPDDQEVSAEKGEQSGKETLAWRVRPRTAGKTVPLLNHPLWLVVPRLPALENFSRRRRAG